MSAPVACLAVAMLAVACSRPIPQAELPSDPVAFLRQEPRQGIASLEDFMDAVEMRSHERDGRRGKRRPRASISLLTLPTGELRPVPDSGVGSLPLDWSRDGLHLLVGRTAGQAGTLQLFTWNLLTGAWDRLSPDRSLGDASLGGGPIRLSLIGRILQQGSPTGHGVLVHTDAGGTRPLPDGLDGRSPDVAADGRTVVFARKHPRPGRDGIILLSSIGATSARAIARGHRPRFSRDGNWIAYVTRRSGNADVWLMRADGSSKRPITRSSFDEDYPAPSSDGSFVIYASTRGGQEESHLYVTRVRDLAEIQVTQNSQNGRPVW